MKAISPDLRQRIFDARRAGEPTAAVAARFAVSPAFVRRLMQRHRRTGSLAPTAQRHGPRPALAGREADLRAAVRQTPDARPAELRDRLGLPVTPWTVWRALRRLGLTFKKKSSGRPSRTARTWPGPGPTGRT